MHSPAEKTLSRQNALSYGLFIVLFALLASGSFWAGSKIVSARRATAPTRKPISDFQLIQWGAVPHPIELRSTSGHTFSIPSSGRLTLIQYISQETTRTEQVVLYAQYLAHDRFPGKLNYVVVLDPSLRDLANSLREMDIPNVAVTIDQDHRFLTNFSLPTDLDSAIAIDPSGTVRFSAIGLVMQDALRTLFVRYAGADKGPEINDDVPMAPYRLGELMPPFEVRDIRTGELSSSQSLAGRDNHPLWIFTADCAMCSLPSYLDKLAKDVDQRPVPIFSSRVPKPILLSLAKKAGFQGPLYVATEEIPIFEDLLHNWSLTPYAASITISKDGRLRDVTPQSPF